MKTALILLSAVLFQSMAFAYPECSKKEGLIIATITDVKTDSMTYCKAYVSVESISYYTMHALCPLDIDDVISQGVSFPLVNGHDCEVYRGDKLDGYLVKIGKKIILD